MSPGLNQNSPAPKHFWESNITYLWPPAPESAAGFPTPVSRGVSASAFWRWEELLGIGENRKESCTDPERGDWVYGKLFLISGPPAATLSFTGTTGSFSSFRSQLKSHFLRKASSEQPV